MSRYPKLKTLTFLMFLVTFSSNVQAQSDLDFLLSNKNDYQTVTIQEVISTDTIIIESLFKKGEKITLIGLKGIQPEKNHIKPQRDKYGFVIEEDVFPAMNLEERALDFARNLMVGQEARLEFDISKKDETLTTTAYVFLKENDLFVNAELIRQGYAELSLSPRNHKYNDKLREAYHEAREEKRGLQGE